LTRPIRDIEKPACAVQGSIGVWACGCSGGDLRLLAASEISCVFVLWMKYVDARNCNAITDQSINSFLDRLLEEMPFPIQRIQTDRGLEFFAEAVQRRLMEWGIKFRPTKPRSPHLNGKVERTQRADLEEFWATADPKSVDLRQRLDEWQHFWNWHRPHTALDGRSPIDRVCELTAITPSADAVDAAYNPTKERIRVSSYVTDKTLARVK